MVGGVYVWLMLLLDGWRGGCRGCLLVGGVVGGVDSWLEEWLEELLVGWRGVWRSF